MRQHRSCLTPPESKHSLLAGSVTGTGEQPDADFGCDTYLQYRWGNGRYGKTLTMKHPSTLNLASGMTESVLSFKNKRIQTALTLSVLSGLSKETSMATLILLGHLYSRISVPYPFLLVFCTQKKRNFHPGTQLYS